MAQKKKSKSLPCPRCNGTKVDPSSKTLPCHKCDGAGVLLPRPPKRKMLSDTKPRHLLTHSPVSGDWYPHVLLLQPGDVVSINGTPHEHLGDGLLASHTEETPLRLRMGSRMGQKLPLTPVMGPLPDQPYGYQQLQLRVEFMDRRLDAVEKFLRGMGKLGTELSTLLAVLTIESTIRKTIPYTTPRASHLRPNPSTPPKKKEKKA